MRLLALDTATDTLAMAVVHADRILTHESAGGAQASTTLMPALLDLLAQAGLTLPSLHAVAMGRGPGAFTGLRTAVSVAQGLAFGLACPVVPVDSLLIVAEDAFEQAGRPMTHAWPVWVAVDARMNEVYAAEYAHDPVAGWQVRTPPGLYDLPTLSARWLAQPPQAIAGNALSAFAGQLPVATAVQWPQVQARAAALGRLAQQAWLAGAHVPADEALPLYLRDKVALTIAEREGRA